MPPMSASIRNAIARARARLADADLSVDEIDADHWRVTAPGRAGPHAEGLLYWPVSDFWRRADGTLRGRGTVTLIAALTEDGEPQ